MIDLKQFERLQAAVDHATQEHAREQGRLDQLMKDLEEKFKVKTIKEAKTALTKLAQEAEEAEEVYNRILKEFLDEFGDNLELTPPG